MPNKLPEVEWVCSDEACDKLFLGHEDADWAVESAVARIAAPDETTGMNRSPTRQRVTRLVESGAQASSLRSAPRTSAQRAATPTHGEVQHGNAVRSWFGAAALILCAALAGFCFYKHRTEEVCRTKPIEDVHPAEKVIIDAPAEALATDFARLAAGSTRR